jgi:hypothetical protein
LGTKKPWETAIGQDRFLREGIYFKPRTLTAPIPANTAGFIPPEVFWAGIKATDITAVHMTNERILSRCAYGMPVLNISVSLKHVDLEIGDFVSVTHPVYLSHQASGSNSVTVFEITRKEVIISEDSPRVDLQLAWVRQGAFVVYPISALHNSGHSLSGRYPHEPTLSNSGTTLFDSSGNAITSVSWSGA